MDAVKYIGIPTANPVTFGNVILFPDTDTVPV